MDKSYTPRLEHKNPDTPLPYEGSGDCSSFIFLDKSTVYSVGYCDGGPGEPSFQITPYRRANL